MFDLVVIKPYSPELVAAIVNNIPGSEAYPICDVGVGSAKHPAKTERKPIKKWGG
jgi:hypothetical protein